VFLKWHNDIVASIDGDWNLTFSRPNFNAVVAIYASRPRWTASMTERFLGERLISRERRDIEKILFRMGLSAYDVFRITENTRGIHPKDLLWVSWSEEERFEDVITDVFNSVFNRKIDLKGDSLDSPEGFNIKRYGVFNGRYGIYKNRLNPLATDCEGEIAVYLIAQKMGVPCCPAYFVDTNTIFSEFLYDFSKEYIVHFRHLIGETAGQNRTENEYQNLLAVRPQYKDAIIKMLLLDFVTRQDDRHLSNIAVKAAETGESFYPLYDNGRSLFYEDTEETVAKALRNVTAFSTAFGPKGTYWDHLTDIAKEGVAFGDLVNLNITKDEVARILKKAGFTGYRYEGGIEWVFNALDEVRRMK
jgi:hypothetical protein